MSPQGEMHDNNFDRLTAGGKQSPSNFTLASTLGDTPGSRSPTSTLSKFDDEAAIPRQVLDRLDVLQLDVDSHGMVRWQALSTSHPRQWPVSRKFYDTTIICLLEFVTTLVSNTGSSAARYASRDIRIDEEVAILCFVTLYLLGRAMGGLVFPPVAESFGGRTIYVVGAAGFAASCALVGGSPTLPALIVGRFMSGFFSAMPTVVAVGSIENMFDSKGRIWVIQIWVMVAILALALGPPATTYVSGSDAGWAWVYYGAAIGCTAIATLCALMKESRPALVLREHVERIAKETSFDGLALDDDLRLPTISEFARNNLLLPLRLWFTEPLVFLVALMAAISFGYIYLFAEALHVVYHNGFGLDERQSSLTFLSIGLGVLFTVVPRLCDVHVTNIEGKQGHALEPEAKLLGYYIAAPLLAIGLWWFSEFDSVLCTYLTDTYQEYAGSANAPVAFLRAILSGVFPLFAPSMFKGLGANNALFLLASIATVFCGIALMFKLYAKRIRERSPFAQKTFDVVVKEERIV